MHVIATWRCGGGANGGFEALQTPALELLRHQHKFPHLNTCKRWIKLLQDEGHLRPKIALGNNHYKCKIHGQDLFNLALFQLIQHKAYLDE